jgi:short-subunit dehydrogenase
MVMMSHWAIPRMLKREKRSAIINLSSVAGTYPLPYISVYSATKALNDFFSQALEMEYSYKIDILSVKPLYVESNLSKMTKSCTVASRNECASASLKYLGLDY